MEKKREKWSMLWFLLRAYVHLKWIYAVFTGDLFLFPNKENLFLTATWLSVDVINYL